MRRIKYGLYSLVVIAGLLMVPASSFAQQGSQPSYPPSAGDIVSRIKDDLNLTEQQVIQVTAIIEEDMAERRALMRQGHDEESIGSKMDQLRQSTDNKLSECLTREQRARFRNRSQSGQDRGNRMGPAGGGRTE